MKVTQPIVFIESSQPLPPPVPPKMIPADQLLNNFLKENHIVLIPTVMNEQCSIADGGILLNEKPLIKLRIQYKEQ